MSGVQGQVVASRGSGSPGHKTIHEIHTKYTEHTNYRTKVITDFDFTGAVIGTFATDERVEVDFEGSMIDGISSESSSSDVNFSLYRSSG